MGCLTKYDLHTIQTRKRKEKPKFVWDVRSVNNVIKRFENTQSIYRKEGSGRPITAHMSENQMKVENLALSQEKST